MIDSLLSLFSKTSQYISKASATLEEKFRIPARPCNILYFFHQKSGAISFAGKREMQENVCSASSCYQSRYNIIRQYTVTSFHACTSKGTVSKTGATETCDLFCNIAAKRVEQHCCPFYYPLIKPVAKKSACCKLRKVVAKVESSSTFRDKICTCYAFSRPTTNLFCNYSCVSQHLFLQ